MARRRAKHSNEHEHGGACCSACAIGNPCESSCATPENPYLGDAFELAEYRKKKEEWERRGRRGPPPVPPRQFRKEMSQLKSKLLR